MSIMAIGIHCKLDGLVSRFHGVFFADERTGRRDCGLIRILCPRGRVEKKKQVSHPTPQPTRSLYYVRHRKKAADSGQAARATQ